MSLQRPRRPAPYATCCAIAHGTTGLRCTSRRGAELPGVIRHTDCAWLVTEERYLALVACPGERDLHRSSTLLDQRLRPRLPGLLGLARIERLALDARVPLHLLLQAVELVVEGRPVLR